MPIDLAARLKEMGLSDRSVGQRVLAAWKRLEPRRSLPKAPSIAAKLGELKRGQTTWWSNHPRALEALGQVLECDPDELLQVTEVGAEELAFPEFPELPPLQMHEDPCFLDMHGWLATHALQALGQGVHAWVQAAGGAGKTLCIRYLQSRAGGNVEAFSARTLVDAASRASASLPLVVEVELTDPATDDAVLRELTWRRTNTCILAPFQRRPLSHRDAARWQDVPWQPHDGWRERLVRWAHSRLLDPERLDVAGLLEWLEDVDASSVLFRTPGELLPLVAWCYRGKGKPTRATKLEVLAEDHFARLFEPAGARHPWLRREGRTVVRALVRRRIEDLDRPNEPLPFDAWVELLPADQAPALADDDLRRRIEVVARERSADARKKRADEALAALAVCRPREAVHLLVEQGVLRASGDGRLDVYPTWARRAFERHVFLERVRSGDVQAWGEWSADASRQQAVDDALDAFTPPDLVEAAARVVREPRAELATAAATEALFAALGRRMLAGWEPTPKQIPTLQALGQRQAELLLMGIPVALTDQPVALTRQIEWNADAQWRFQAWVYSLKVPPPSPIPAEIHWMMPGWANDLRLADAPRHLFFPDVQGGWGAQLTNIPQHLDGMLAVSRKVLQLCMDAHPPESVQEVFLPWLLLDAREKGWELSPEHRRNILTSPVLARVLAAEPPDIREQVIVELWSDIVRQGSNPLRGLLYLHHDRRDLFAIVTDHLPRQQFEADLLGIKLHSSDIERLAMLPQDLRRSVLRAAAMQSKAGTPLAFTGLEPWLASLNHDDLDLLVQLAADRYSVGTAAAKRVYELDARRALDEAQAVLEQGASTASWFVGAPPSHWRELVDILESHGIERVPWGARWLARILSRAGSDAPRVFKLLSHQQSRRPSEEADDRGAGPEA